MSTFLTSDTHFNHVNILLPTYCNRPFTGVPDMNEGLIRNWNAVVSPGDTVYHIGDFAMGDKDQIPVIRARLNGKIILIRGNHDLDRKGKLLKQIEATDFEIHEELTTSIEGVKVYMRHEPLMEFVPREDADFHVCGHVHNSWNRKGSILNAGVDVNDYRPVTIRQLIAMVEVEGKSHRGY